MAESSFSDISSVAGGQDNFECERMLFSGVPAPELPSISSTQKMTHNLETNCSNKSEVICEGSFMKGLQRFQREISYDESIYDIYSPSKEYYAKESKGKLRSDKEVLKGYVVTFQKSKSNKKSVSKFKSPGLSSLKSLGKLSPSHRHFHQSKPSEEYYTARGTPTYSKLSKPNTERYSKPLLAKVKASKQKQLRSSRSRSKISVGKSKFLQKQSVKSAMGTK